MTTPSLEEIQIYFGDNLTKFFEEPLFEHFSETNKKILFQIGLPNYEGLGGYYEILDKFVLIDKEHFQFATVRYNASHGECVNLKTGNVVGCSIDKPNEFWFINSDLEAYLRYIYVLLVFTEEVTVPQKLGSYYQKHEKYAAELKKRFQQINNDVEKDSVWAGLIEEMENGVL